MRFQKLNPLDTIFHIGDRVRQRLRLPGTHIQLVLELGGRLDPKRFLRAVATLHRRYPATAARLECDPILGRPRWRLPTPDDPTAERAAYVRVTRFDPPDARTLHTQLEELIVRPIRADARPPLQFNVFRGMPTGDVLAMRWPHALMDARGGALIIEELQTLYEQNADPDGIESAGDEARDDFAQLIAAYPLRKRYGLLLRGGHGREPAGWRDLRFDRGASPRREARLRFTLRTLSVADSQRMRDAALRVGGFGRTGDFIRACALFALDRVLPGRQPAGAGFSTMQLVDNRKRRARAPICRNLFSALPIYIPRAQARDRRATTESIAQQTGEMLSSGVIAERFAVLERAAQLPPAVLTEMLLQAMAPGRRTPLGRGLGQTPTLPMGFVGSFTRPMPEFCGVALRNVYGLGVIAPHEGFALNLNTPNEQLNITAAWYEPRVSAAAMARFLDGFVAALLSVD